MSQIIMVTFHFFGFRVSVDIFSYSGPAVILGSDRKPNTA